MRRHGPLDRPLLRAALIQLSWQALALGLLSLV